MTELKMYRITVKPPVPTEFMVYAVSKVSAPKVLQDFLLGVELATPLQITAHVRAGLPIIGEPTPPDPNQQPLPIP